VISKKRVLVCPLDWGLGHATRCIPIIHALLEEGAEVIMASEGAPLALLQEEFPALKAIVLPGYGIHYSRRLPMMASMLFQSPKILLRIIREHRRLKKIIRNHQMDCVISDNRYGLWNKTVRTVFITHQLSIKCPAAFRFIEPLLYKINLFFIKKFDECWIPDAAGKGNLSGELSHAKPLPSSGAYIGMLSRFDFSSEQLAGKKYKFLAIISGPEPYRSLLLEKMILELKKANAPALIVAGEPHKKYTRMLDDNVRLVSHLNAADMKEAILHADVIICRAGYSGIMDLASLKKKAILIPTPGQTEQEYLAQYLSEKKMFYAISQSKLNLEAALNEINQFGDFSEISFEKKYLNTIKGFLEKVN